MAMSSARGRVNQTSILPAQRRLAPRRSPMTSQIAGRAEQKPMPQPNSTPALGDYDPSPSLPSRSTFFLAFSSIRGFCFRSKRNPNGLKTIAFCDSFATEKQVHYLFREAVALAHLPHAPAFSTDCPKIALRAVPEFLARRAAAPLTCSLGPDATVDNGNG